MRRVVAIGAAVAMVMAAGAAPAAAQQEAEQPTLAAAGIGRVLVPPDQAEVYVSVHRRAPTSRAARNLVNRRVEAINRAALGQGVAAEDISTVGVSVSRVHRRARRGRPARTFYAASSDLTVLVRDVARTGAVVDALTDAGGNVYGPDFSLSDSTAAQIEATRAALADARRRADDAAASTGHRIVGIRSIDIAPEIGGFATADEEGGGGAGRAGTQIRPGRETVIALVRVVYTIAPA
jgi:uncharacterized protein